MRAGMCIILLMLATGSVAQNLVPNGSFEQYYKCPGSYNYSTNGKIAPGWTSPSTGTPDIFNTCSIGEAGVPANWAGRSKAFNGSGYAGIYLYIHGRAKAYREYLQAEFTSPLQAGVKYIVEFQFKLSSNSKYSVDRIGFLISDSSYHTHDDGVFPARPTYQRINPVIYNQNTGYWTRFGFTYEAKGGERFITIGNFSSDADTRYYFIAGSQALEPLLYKAAYFFVDDVKVLQISEPPKAAPVLTGYAETKTNEVYVLRNIQFKFNEYLLLETSFAELNKVTEILNYHKTWKVVVSGHTDDIGTNAYNLDLSLNRAGSVADYLIKRGIDPARIKTQGFGKQTPLQKGNDEATRAINRRVELRFLN
jgi:OmpA-OmpF porin, OOP family